MNTLSYASTPENNIWENRGTVTSPRTASGYENFHDLGNPLSPYTKLLVKFAFETVSITTSIASAISPQVCVAATPPALAYLGQKIANYKWTIEQLSSASLHERESTVYDRFIEVVESDRMSVSALCTVIERQDFKYKNTLISCFADLELPLDHRLSHTLIGQLHSDNQSIVNCACLALLAGGEYSRYQLSEMEQEEKLPARAADFLRKYKKLRL